MMRPLLVLAACLSFAAPVAAQSSAPLIVVQPTATAPTTAPTYGTTLYSAPQYVPTGRGRERAVVGVRHEQQNDRGLWGAGLGLFLGGWAADIALTALGNAISNDRPPSAEEDALAWSLLPLVGPIVQLGIGAPHPAIPILGGVMQITGLVLFVMGMTSTHDAEVPIYAFGDPHDARTARLGMSLSPTAGGAYASFTLHAM
jgi:hypothetical protein